MTRNSIEKTTYAKIKVLLIVGICASESSYACPASELCSSKGLPPSYCAKVEIRSCGKSEADSKGQKSPTTNQIGKLKSPESSPATTSTPDPSTTSRDSLKTQGVSTQDAAAIAQLKRGNVDQGLLAADKIEQQSLIDAQQSLRLRAQAALQASAPGSSISSEQSNIINDASVINRVATKYQNEKAITPDDVNAAKIPEVRADLQDVLYSQRFSEKLAVDRKQLTDTISSLLGLSAQSFKRAQGLNSTSGENSGLAASSEKGRSESRDSALAGSHSRGEVLESNNKAEVSDAESASKNKEMLQAIANMKPIDGSSLRDRLKKKLALARAAEDAKLAALKSAGGNDIFEGKLSAADAASRKDSAQGAGTSLVAQAVDSALRSSNAADQQRFSLAGAETDAAVQKLLRTPSSAGELASLADSGVQSANSSSLFERVRAAHTHCLKQKCVQAN